MRLLRAAACLFLCICAASGCRPDAAAASPESPNFLLILGDDMMYHDLGVYGNDQVHTPNLDRLASEGITFRHAYNSAPMCAPTRMSLYTGLHPVRSGAWPNHSRVYPDVRSMPHYLGDLGYRVALIGKRHEAPPRNFPFEYLGGRHHDDGDGVDMDLSRVRDFLDENRENSWALVVSSNQPHIPNNRGVQYAYDPEELVLPPYLVDTEETRHALARYYAEVSYLDEQVGTVLDHLRESGEASETVVIFLSEQGAAFPHGKWTCYDTGVRSAAIVRWPGVNVPGSSTDAMIQYTDVLPTLIELAGADLSTFDFDGSSFAAVLRGEADEHHRYAFSIQTSAGIYSGPDAYGIRSVRDDRFRLIWNVNPENTFSNMVTERMPLFESWRKKAEAGDPFAQQRVQWYLERPEYELYDHVNDTFELDNVAADPAYQETVQRLLRELKAWMREQGDRGAETEIAAPERQVEEREW